MKNLSLLFLAFIASHLEAAEPRKKKHSWKPVQQVIETQPASMPQFSPLPLSESTASKSSKFDSPHLPNPVSNVVIRSYEEWNEGRGDRSLKRFEETGDISKMLREADFQRYKKSEAPKESTDIRNINDRLQAIPYVRPVDETESLKADLYPAIEALKTCGESLSHLSQAKTKELKSEIYAAIPEPEPTKNPRLPFNVKTRHLSGIVALMAKKQIDSYAISTESSRIIADCGQSIIEGSRISDIEHTATNFAPTPTEKTAILETKRIAEFTTLLAQLESYTRTRDLETISQAKLDELEAKARTLETSLLHPTSETARIETERALLSIVREKAGVIGQLEGARKDRVQKNNAIVIARTEAGSIKASLFAGYLGAKTADYVSNTQETPLMIDEVFSKVLPHLSKEEKRKKALAFLEILAGKTRASSPTRLTWTGQQSIKTLDYPEFSCIIEGKDLSGKKGTEREPLLFSTDGVEPIKTIPAVPLLTIYKKRAGLISTEAATRESTPSLDELHARREEKLHWFARGFDDKTLKWEYGIKSAQPVTASDEPFAI